VIGTFSQMDHLRRRVDRLAVAGKPGRARCSGRDRPFEIRGEAPS
jgi:hypothetical protein